MELPGGGSSLPGVPLCFGVEHWLRWSSHNYSEILLGRSGSRRGKKAAPAHRTNPPDAPGRFRRLLWAATVVLLLAAAGGSLRFFSLHEPDSFARQASLSLFVARPLRYDLWYQVDFGRLSSLAAHPLTSPERSRLKLEEAALRQELAALDRSGGYRDPRGFRVYPPAVTGKLQALGLARRNRARLLAGAGRAALAQPGEVFRMAGYQVYRTLPRKFPVEQEVVRALQGVRVPDVALRGYRVYLLPGSLGDMSGAGGHGYTLLGGEPLTVRLVNGQYASTATHELAHHLSLSRLGGHLSEAPREWGRYLKLRGIPGWRDDGAVNTAAWSLSPEEALAEDFRVLFGTGEAASLPYNAGYEDPRLNPALSHRLRQFLTSLAELPEKSAADGSPTPWLDDVGAGTADQGAGAAWLSSQLAALGPRRILLAALLLVTAAGLISVIRLSRRPQPASAVSSAAPSRPAGAAAL